MTFKHIESKIRNFWSKSIFLWIIIILIFLVTGSKYSRYVHCKENTVKWPIELLLIGSFDEKYNECLPS